MIKAIFFDIDGTLLSHTLGDIPKSTREALEQLRQKGIKTFIATGRHLLEMKDMPMLDMRFDGYVTLNGQICLDEDENIVVTAPIDPKDAECFLEVFRKKEIAMMLVEKDRMYMNFVNENVEAAQKAISTAIPACEEYSGEVIYQFVVYVGEQEEEKIVSLLPHCKITRWNPYGVDVIPKDGGKVSGIEAIIKSHNISREEIMAFGDGDNDMDMLAYAGVGIAMGNAEEKVKLEADYVSDTVDHDGVMKALQHFGIL